MADKQAIMQLVNMLSGTLQGIGQQRQQGSQFRAQVGMQQQQIQMQQQRIAEEKARWQAGEPQRKAQAEATKLQIDTLKHEADISKQKEEVGGLISEYLAQEGITNFTSAEQAFESVPGLKEYGSQIGYIGDVLAPYMKEPISPAELLQWGASYDQFIKANPQYSELVTPEAWDKQSSDMARIRELELENPELANELKGVQLALAQKDFENYDRILDAKLKPPSRGPSGGDSQAANYLNALNTIKMAEAEGYDPPQWALDIVGAKGDGGGGGEFDSFGEQLLRAGQLGGDALSGQAGKIVGTLQASFTDGNLSVDDIKRFADWAGVGYTNTDTVGDILGYLPDGLIALGQPYMGASGGGSGTFGTEPYKFERTPGMQGRGL